MSDTQSYPFRALDALTGALERVERAVGTTRALSSYLRREAETWNTYPLSLRQRFDAWRHGFMSRDYALLDLDNEEMDEYLSAVSQARLIAPSVTPTYHDIFRNKVAFHLATGPYLPDATPTFYGTITDGTFTAAPTYDGGTTLTEVIDAEGAVVCKRVTGTGGRGVYHIAAGEEPPYQVDGQPCSADALTASLGDDIRHIVTEKVENHEQIASISPSSVNTVRMLTVQDPSDGEPFIASAVHRFGLESDGITDNWSGGGCAAPVDVERGRLGKIHRYLPRTGLQKYVYHPGSGTMVSGRPLPHWESVVSTVLEMARLHNENPYVGWDVVITPDGPVILEGNAAPHLALQQLGGGLLADGRVRECLERWS